MPASRSKKRSTRIAASKSDTSSEVVETHEKEKALVSVETHSKDVSTTQPDLLEPELEPDFSSPGSILQTIFDSQHLKPKLPRKRLKPPGLPRSLLFRYVGDSLKSQLQFL